jgi:muramoyltetrapeptide carboxypeptidase LdcA involved in peptidoglycan recycling
MSTMVHLGRGGGVQPATVDSLRAALFTGGELEVRPSELFSDQELSWADPAALTQSTAPYASPGRVWHQADRVVSAPTWGGNLEILHWTLATDRWVRPVADYAGCVLLLETSEEMPSSEAVFRMLRDFGERGLLEQFPAIVVATAKGSVFSDPRPVAERSRYRDEQQGAVLRAVEIYNPGAMVVFGVDFGHTDPQWVLPYGGRLTVDGPARRIIAHY